MDIQEIKQLIKIFEKSDIGELELEEDGLKIRMCKSSPLASAPQSNGMMNPVYVQAQAPAPVAEAAAPGPEPAASSETKPDSYIEIRSPMVGTFYRSPAPDADPYVDIGDMVNPETTLCIIEAMKLMNEIQAEHSGKIAKILVENGQPVEYNQVLFLLEK